MATEQGWAPRDTRWPVQTWSDLVAIPHRGFGDWRQALRAALATALAFLIASHLGPERFGVLAALYALQGSQQTPIGTFSAVTQQVVGAWFGLLIGFLGLAVFGSVTVLSVLVVAIAAMLVAQLLPMGMIGRLQVLLMTAFAIGFAGWQPVGSTFGWFAADVLIGAVMAMVVVLAWPSRFPIHNLEVACRDLVDQVRAALSTTAGQLRVSAGSVLDIHEHHDFREVGDGLTPKVQAGNEAAARGRESAVWNWRAQSGLSKLDRLEDKWDWLGVIQEPLRVLVRVIDDLYDHADRQPPLLDRATLVSILEETRSLFEVAAGTLDYGDIGKASERVAGKIGSAQREVLDRAPRGDRNDPMVIGSIGLLDRIDVIRGRITNVPH